MYVAVPLVFLLRMCLSRHLQIHETVSAGGKVLLPVSAVGRAQELLLLLDEHWERNQLTVRHNTAGPDPWPDLSCPHPAFFSISSSINCCMHDGLELCCWCPGVGVAQAVPHAAAHASVNCRCPGRSSVAMLCMCFTLSHVVTLPHVLNVITCSDVTTLCGADSSSMCHPKIHAAAAFYCQQQPSSTLPAICTANACVLPVYGFRQVLLLLLLLVFLLLPAQVPIYFSGAMGSRASQYYRLLLNWTSERIKQGPLGSRAAAFAFHRVLPWQQQLLHQPVSFDSCQ
jgi:hypothetical protein